MADLPTCLCVRGLPPYDRLTAIYQAAAELSGDGDLPDPVCVAGVPPFSRFSYIYEAFRVFTVDDSLPSQICVAGESPQDQVSRIYQAVAIYADDSSLKSYQCVRGMPIWQQWIEIYRALYVSAGSPDSLVNPNCVTIANLDVLSDVFCALTAGGNATLLASFYIPEIVDSFERSIAAGYTGDGDPETFQREAAVDVLRDDHYQDGIDGQLVILEDVPTLCEIIMQPPIVTPGELQFDASYDAAEVTVSLQKYQYRIDAGGAVDNGTNLTLTDIAASAGNHTLGIRAVSTSGVFGPWATSATFTVAPSSGGGANFFDDLLDLSPSLLWDFAEASGTVAEDISGNNRDGTYENVTLGVTSPLTASGKTCADFNGTSSQAYRLTESALSPTGEYTVMALVSPGAISAFQAVIAKAENGTAAGRQYEISVTNANVFRAVISIGSSFNVITGTTTVSGSDFYLVALRVEDVGGGDKTVSLWVNGASEGTPVTSSGSFDTNSGNMAAGQLGGVGSLFLDGTMVMAAIFQSAIPDATMADLWDATDL